MYIAKEGSPKNSTCLLEMACGDVHLFHEVRTASTEGASSMTARMGCLQRPKQITMFCPESISLAKAYARCPGTWHNHPPWLLS